jgi:excisionase family DNA binding protein
MDTQAQEGAQMENEKLTLSVEQAAKACGLSERTMRELIARHEMPVVRVGRRVLIVRAQLEAWLNERAAIVA